MPELIALTTEAIPQVVENEKDNKNVPLAANDPILIEVEKATGIRITGGKDFDMPITIFHVILLILFHLFREKGGKISILGNNDEFFMNIFLCR